MGFIARGVRFARAYVKWVKAGRPLRDAQYVRWLFDNFCSKCEQYEPHGVRRGRCKACECRIIGKPSGGSSKLDMPTEACPLGYWRADVDGPSGVETFRLPKSD